jgi:hypothetical protein
MVVIQMQSYRNITKHCVRVRSMGYENISMGCTNCMQGGSDVDWAHSIPWLYSHSSQLLNNVIGWGVDYIGYFWHPPLASPVVIMWKVVSRHLFLNIIPNNFMVGIGGKRWCDPRTKAQSHQTGSAFYICRWISLPQWLSWWAIIVEPIWWHRIWL